MWWRLSFVVAVLVILLDSVPAVAQFGTSGGRTLGGSITSRARSTTSRSTVGMSGFGLGGLGTSGFGAGTLDSGSLFGGDPFNTGGTFLIRRQEGTFIGTDSRDLPRVFGGMVTGSTTYGGTGLYGTASRTGLGGYSSSGGGIGSTFRSGVGSSFGSIGTTSYRSPYGSSASTYGSAYRSPYGSYTGTGSTYGSRYGAGYGGTSGQYGSTYRSPYATSYGSSSYRPGSSTYGSGLGGYGSTYRSSYGRSGAYGSAYGTYARRGTGGMGAAEMQTGITLAFAAPRPAVEQVLPTLTARLERTPQIRFRSPVAVTLREGTAILRGVVASEHDRELAEQLARLEPGVLQVQNELLVLPTEAGASPAPPRTSAAPTSLATPAGAGASAAAASRAAESSAGAATAPAASSPQSAWRASPTRPSSSAWRPAGASSSLEPIASPSATPTTAAR